MKHKTYLLYIALVLILFGCASAPRPIAAKSDYCIRFSTEMALGESFTFYTDAEEKERDGVWLDRFYRITSFVSSR